LQAQDAVIGRPHTIGQGELAAHSQDLWPEHPVPDSIVWFRPSVVTNRVDLAESASPEGIGR
jgi:hypothetical protein